MSDASDFLKKWVRKNVKAATAAMHDDPSLRVGWSRSVCGKLREKT
jgi:hypothetical protein